MFAFKHPLGDTMVHAFQQNIMQSPYIIIHVTQLVDGYSYGLPIFRHQTTPFLYGKMYIVRSCFNVVFLYLNPTIIKTHRNFVHDLYYCFFLLI